MGIFGNTFGGQQSPSFNLYWKNKFTGIPVLYSGTVSGGNIRRLILKDGIYIFFGELYVDSKWKIIRETSSDGLIFTDNRTALLTNGGVGEFDEIGQADPSVIYEGNGDWKMWYDATESPLNIKWTLGYATSVDGETWTKYGKILDVGGVGEWDEGHLHHPVCLKHNGIYYLYYSGAPKPYGHFVKNIGLATSTDGINWTKHPSNPIISIGQPGSWEDWYVRPSLPIYIYGTWYMWYYGDNTGLVMQCGLATSKDLITWTKSPLNPVITNTSGARVTATTPILYSGTNPLDRLVCLWYENYADSVLKYSTVTLPTTKTRVTDFQDRTVVSHLLPIEFDKTAGDIIYSNTPNTKVANFIYLYRITVSSTMTPNYIGLYLYASSMPTTGTISAAIYANGSDTPTSRLVLSDVTNWSSLVGDGWSYIKISSPFELIAGDYWIAITSTGSYYSTKAAGGVNNWGHDGNVNGGVFPATISAVTSYGYNNVDIFVAEMSSKVANIYRAVLSSELTNVYFNNVLGVKMNSVSEIVGEYQWKWELGFLYIYSSQNANVIYQITYD
jgi:hypothetical protein